MELPSRSLSSELTLFKRKTTGWYVEFAPVPNLGTPNYLHQGVENLAAILGNSM